MAHSPCIEVCEMDPHTGYCLGCYRSLDEIAHWTQCSETEQRQIINMTHERKINARSKAGLSLMELAVVLVIVALITGTVYSAKEYIQDAAIRKQIVQLENIQGAIRQFESKYQCYPGDCADPTTITDYTYTGNNNGFLSSTWNDDENKGFWLHLVQSKMIETMPLVAHDVLAGMQTPRAALNGGAAINAVGNIATGENALIMGTSSVSGSITLVELTSIDEKIDDAIAASGAVRSTGYGTGATTIYSNNPFPLSINNDGGSAQCIAAGVYANTNTKCNMVYILSK